MGSRGSGQTEKALVTELLRAWSDGDRAAGAEALELVYDELHRIAAACFRSERPDHTLQATAVLHEAYLRLDADARVRWNDRNHFYSVAARLMRRVLVDHSRERGAAKRGGGARRVSLADAEVGTAAPPPDLVALDDALTDLGEVDPRKAALVELRFFGGLSMEEAAGVLAVSRKTAGREWQRARAWLLRQLSAGDGGSGEASHGRD